MIQNFEAFFFFLNKQTSKLINQNSANIKKLTNELLPDTTLLANQMCNKCLLVSQELYTTKKKTEASVMK